MENTEVPIQSISESKSKKIVVIAIGIVAVLVLILLGTILFLNNSRQITNTTKVIPTPTIYIPPDLLVTVGDTRIYRSTVRAAAEEQYEKSAITNQVLNKFLEKVVEQRILYLEAQKRNIKVSGKSTDEYYQQLKNKLIPLELLSISAYTVEFWVPPYTDPQESLYEQQRTIGSQALEEGLVKLKNGETPLSVGQYIYKQYSILQSIIAINGYLVKTIVNTEALSKPRLYVFDKRNEGQPFYDVLFSLKKGDIKKVMWENGAGGTLIQVISKSNGEKESYEEWLKRKKKELVKYHNQI